VISTPLHVQDVPARYAPQMGWEGANVIFDTWVHPLMMGLEEHLIGMFRHDFEFVDGHRSHLGDGAPSLAPVVEAMHEGAAAGVPTGGVAAGGPVRVGAGGVAVAEAPAESGVASVSTAVAAARPAVASATPASAPAGASAPGVAGEPVWTADGEAELHKIPFFVRGKVRRNTETFARERGIGQISSETLYDAKAHFSR
jgi:light-independent protochlorophyllide reductase subunit B